MVAFTVLTSPDSDKANMYGHKPETFTASNGVEFNARCFIASWRRRRIRQLAKETNETPSMANYLPVSWRVHESDGRAGDYQRCTAINLQRQGHDRPWLPIKKKMVAGDSLLKIKPSLLAVYLSQYE